MTTINRRMSKLWPNTALVCQLQLFNIHESPDRSQSDDVRDTAALHRLQCSSPFAVPHGRFCRMAKLADARATIGLQAQRLEVRRQAAALSLQREDHHVIYSCRDDSCLEKGCPIADDTNACSITVQPRQ